MIFEITKIVNAGDLERERIILKAREAGDVGRFAVFAGLNTQNGSIASGKIPYAYWFMDQEMKAGDLAVLYTKAGRRSEKTSENGSTSYFFYWGLNSPIWTRSMHRAVLVNTATWAFSKETPQSST